MDHKIFLFFLYLAAFFFGLSAPLSSVAISQKNNDTVVCALVSGGRTEARITCYFPGWNPENFSLGVGFGGFDALVGGVADGVGFVCAVRSSNSAIHCWNLNNVSRSRRISQGVDVADFQAGGASVCVLDQVGRVQWWRWPRLVFPAWSKRKLSSIAAGDRFFCGIPANSGNVTCSERSGDWSGTPSGNMGILAAGSRHACGVAAGTGMVVCWERTGGRRFDAPKHEPFEFVQLALGANRTCALRTRNRTVVCWGDARFALPNSLSNTEFVHIHGKDTTFCGVVSVNYSLACWNADGGPHVMLGPVLPGACVSTCPCAPLSGSGNLCRAGKFICPPCGALQRPNSPPPVTHSLPPPPLNSPPQRRNRSNNKRTFIVLGSMGMAVGVASLIFLLKQYVCRRHGGRIHDSGPLEPLPLQSSSQPSHPTVHRKPSPQLDKLESLGVRPKLEGFPLEMLQKATENFSSTFRIGSGSFGSVYEATLPDGRHVAVKRAETPSPSSVYVKHYHRDNEQAFQAELALLSRLNHKNLVQLIGFCKEEVGELEQILVYEYMPNKSIHDHLHKRADSPLNGWIPRIRVALDAARGIEYLHTYAVPPIIHRDIKSANILLDAGWIAKISDFGLAIMGPTDQSGHLSLRAAGTVGYMDPQYYNLQQLSTKSDVYSFGVVLLELLTGFKAIHKDEDESAPRNVVDFAVPYIIHDQIHEVLDLKLPMPTPHEIESVTYVGLLAADCVNHEGKDRPTMTEVVSSLERALCACLRTPSVSRSQWSGPCISPS